MKGKSKKVTYDLIKLLVFSSVTFFGLLIILNIPLIKKNNFENQKTVLAEQEEKPDEENYLETLIQNSPNYFPAYLELIKINLEKGNLPYAKNLFSKAILLNPNSEELRELQNQLD